jgi:hypothetical protein
MGPFGFDLTFGDRGLKCASLTTGAQPNGTYEFYVHLLAGPGVQRHLHAYAQVDSDGLVLTGGSRLRENTGQHLGQGIRVANSTQELARFAVREDGAGLTTRLLQCVDDTWIATSASTWARPVTRRTVLLPGSSHLQSAEYSIAMFDAAYRQPSGGGPSTVLPFSAPLPFGLSITLVDP